MEKLKLKAAKRTVKGRKVKNLRSQNLIPGNIYGRKIKSQAVEVNNKDFLSVYHEAGETGLVNLSYEDKNVPVLIHNVQVHPVTREILHVDFLGVDLKQKVTARVPLVINGESPAVKDKTGVLLHIMDEVEIEALPADLPENIGIDVSALAKIDQSVKVADLKISDKIQILTDSGLDLVKIAPLVSREAEAMAREEEEKAEAQKEEAQKEEEKAETEASAKAKEAERPQEKATEKSAEQS